MIDLCSCSKREELFVVMVLLFGILFLSSCCYVVRVKSKGADLFPDVKNYAVLLCMLYRCVSMAVQRHYF